MRKCKLFQIVAVLIFNYQFVYADALLLNEYNAVSFDKQLKDDGYDIYFGDIDGNGGNWIELVVNEDYLDLRGSIIEIKKSGTIHVFSATFPNLTELAYLRKGTILTISELPTDLSYSPINITSPDWTINLNATDLENRDGTFETSNLKMDVSIISSSNSFLMQHSGESVFGSGIDDKEVFKLKKEPSSDIQPNDPAYGDDNNNKVISTFGLPNQWIDVNNVVIHQNFDNLREINSNLNTMILLNEYDAVDENKRLKEDGYDTYFGQVDGNGGSWIELIILKDKIDLRGAEIKVFGKYSNTNFKATFPNIEVLSELRSGSVLTISTEVATDLSYDPFNEDVPDWRINIHEDDLIALEGEFLTDNLKLLVSMRSGSGDVTILPETGEGSLGGGIDNKEVFKLKKNPSLAITPNDSAYGDDLNQKILSTFGTENHWMEGASLVKQDFSNLRLIAMKNNFYKDNKISLVLNEYNAVASNEYLKDSGSDSYFGQIEGNGGSWLEMVVIRDYLNIQNSTIKILENGTQTFSAKIPELLPLAYLRKGTIITISDEPTDMTYAPFAPNSNDWRLNINIDELTNQIGLFMLNANNIDISIIDDGGNNILANSGEGIWNSVVDTQEVYKLKSEADKNTTPFESSYGDDNNLSAISTFSYPNQWLDDNGTSYTQKLIVRDNKDLVEVDGIITANIEGLNLGDGESLLYISANNSLWITDDSNHAVYEIDMTTKEIKTIFTDEDLGIFAPDIQDECNNHIGACDIESIAYDENNDTFYIFVGKSYSTPAVFKLTRNDINEQFVLNDYRKLDGIEYPATQFIDGDFIVSIGEKLYLYDFETNQVIGNALYEIPTTGSIVGLAYQEDILWITTLKFELLKVNWQTKELEASYNMNDNGVYDPRGLEIINSKLYILDGINYSGDEIVAPLGHPLKGAIHIYETNGATPIITMEGNSTEIITINSSYTDAGATATDSEDGTINVTTTGVVDTTALGTYTITYTTIDSDGNIATKLRTIYVVIEHINVPNDYETIREAISHATDGDLIILEPGIHIENGEITIPQNSLTIASKYYFTGDESYISSTIIKGNNDRNIDMFNGNRDDNGSKNLCFIGLTAKETGKFVTFTYGDNNLVDHCILDHIGRDAVSFDTAATGTVTYCTIDSAGDDAIDVDTKEGKTGGGFEFSYNTIFNANDDAIEIHLWSYGDEEKIEETMHFNIHHNTINNSDNDAIQLIDFDKTQQGIDPSEAIDYSTATNRTFEIHNNTIENNGQVGIGAIFQSTNHTDSSRPLSRHFEGANMGEAISIHDNIFRNNAYHILGGDNMDVKGNEFIDATAIAIKRVKGDSAIHSDNTFIGNAEDFEDSNN